MQRYMVHVVTTPGEVRARCHAGECAEFARQMRLVVEAAVQRVSRLQPGSTLDRKLLPGRLPVAYWLDLKAHPSSSYLDSFSRPILVLQGERDLNVGADEAAEWRRLLAGKAAVTIRSYPTLNHLFMFSDGKTGTKENLQPGNVAPPVISALAVASMPVWGRPSPSSLPASPMRSC